jgi:6-phosphofructokinase 1
VNSELTYDLRSGEADSLDQMVAITFANIAVDLIGAGVHGRMIAIADGKYAHVPIPDPGPARRVDVAEMYNLERFRPQYHDRVGMPLLLGSHGVGARPRLAGAEARRHCLDRALLA